MVWVTIGVDAILMGFNQFGKLLTGHQPLPFQAVFPTFEKSECASFGTVAPEISKAFLEDIGRVQTPVGLEQFFQRISSKYAQILASRKQGITLAFDVTLILTTESFVFTTSDFIESL